MDSFRGKNNLINEGLFEKNASESVNTKNNVSGRVQKVIQV